MEYGCEVDVVSMHDYPHGGVRFQNNQQRPCTQSRAPDRRCANGATLVAVERHLTHSVSTPFSMQNKTSTKAFYSNTQTQITKLRNLSCNITAKLQIQEHKHKSQEQVSGIHTGMMQHATLGTYRAIVSCLNILLGERRRDAWPAWSKQPRRVGLPNGAVLTQAPSVLQVQLLQ